MQMQIWADLLDALTPAQVDWILQSGREERVMAGTVLVEEGGELEAIYFLIEGLAHAKTRALGGQVLAVLSPGEVMGEMSFIDRQRASATIEAAEDCLVLVLPRDVLTAQLSIDVGFAANFYRALALIACRRLRATASRLGAAASGGTGPAVDDEEMLLQQEVEAGVERFRRALIDAEGAAGLSDGEVPEAVAVKVAGEFQKFSRLLHERIGELLDPPSALNQQIGRRVQREMLPYVSLAELGDRLYKKPRGYGGDVSSLELIYRHEPAGEGVLGPLLDRCLLDTPGIAALRHRRALLAAEIGRTVEACEGPARVMSLPCGPASEIFDVFEQLEDPKSLEATLIDVDFQALLFISDLAQRRGLKDQLKMTVKNLVYLALGRTDLEAPEQDLIYSAGLIDYFNDQMVLQVVDHLHGLLRPGGKLILGSFHPRNPDKALFDYVLEWKLIHRTEEDLSRLLEASRFGRGAERVRYEEGQIYFLAECVKS